MFEVATESYKFELVMKVDDDTFINPYLLGQFYLTIKINKRFFLLFLVSFSSYAKMFIITCEE